LSSIAELSSLERVGSYFTVTSNPNLSRLKISELVSQIESRNGIGGSVRY